MAPFRLTLEYDGGDFHGWQIQPGVRTVTGALLDAVQRITGERPTALTAAGRTDAGAHAHAQVVGFELTAPWQPRRLRDALNGVLPPDVAVVDAALADRGFDARRDALTRTYRYVVVCRDTRSPVLRRHAWHVSGALDLDAMRAAARMLEGTHDFGAFGGPTRPGGGTTRTVHSVTVERGASPDITAAHRADVVVIAVEADAFLRGMMRAIAGALVAVGRRRQTAAWVDDLLRSGAQRPAMLTIAPAHGLHQWAVTYPASSEGARAA